MCWCCCLGCTWSFESGVWWHLGCSNGSSPRLELAGFDLLAGKSQASVGSGSSFLLLAGVGSGGASIHCHLFSSGEISYSSGRWSPVYVVVVLAVAVSVGRAVLLAVAVEVVAAGASGGGLGLGGTGMRTWPLNGSSGFCCLGGKHLAGP